MLWQVSVKYDLPPSPPSHPILVHAIQTKKTNTLPYFEAIIKQQAKNTAGWCKNSGLDEKQKIKRKWENQDSDCHRLRIATSINTNISTSDTHTKN